MLSQEESARKKETKIIYVFERRHGYTYDYDMFQMDAFTSKGYEVEVWSAVNWTFPNVDEPQNKDESGRTRYINNLEDLISQLERVKNEKCMFLVYPYHAYGYISYLIRKKICKAGFKFCNITESPAFEGDYTKCRLLTDCSQIGLFGKQIRRDYRSIIALFAYPVIKLRNAAKNKESKTFIERVRYLYAHLVGPFKYKSLYNFVTTELLFNTFPNYLEVKSKRNKLIHAVSYDEYMEAGEETPLLDEEYVLFVDDYMIGHSDFEKTGMKFPVSDKEGYLKRINYLFDRVEELYGINVVIAAHPKAEYKGDEFGGRKLIYFKTKQLIKYAKMVIIELSTCMGTMLLNKRDFLLMYSSEYFENVPLMERDIMNASEFLECQPLDIMDSDAVNNVKSYINLSDDRICHKYINRFVVSDKGVFEKRQYEAICEMLEGVI